MCGLCNRINQFVLPRDGGGAFDFASLQSETGRSLLRRFGHNPDDLDTFHVVADYRSDRPVLLSKGRAALFVAGRLTRPWAWLRALRVLPGALLDWAYDRVARNRYRLFGRSDACLLPRPEWKGRFIDV